jgi:hypothetical protein
MARGMDRKFFVPRLRVSIALSLFQGLSSLRQINDVPELVILLVLEIYFFHIINSSSNCRLVIRVEKLKDSDPQISLRTE